MDTFPPSEISGFEWGDIIGEKVSIDSLLKPR